MAFGETIQLKTPRLESSDTFTHIVPARISDSNWAGFKWTVHYLDTSETDGGFIHSGNSLGNVGGTILVTTPNLLTSRTSLFTDPASGVPITSQAALLTVVISAINTDTGANSDFNDVIVEIDHIFHVGGIAFLDLVESNHVFVSANITDVSQLIPGGVNNVLNLPGDVDPGTGHFIHVSGTQRFVAFTSAYYKIPGHVTSIGIEHDTGNLIPVPAAAFLGIPGLAAVFFGHLKRRRRIAA